MPSPLDFYNKRPEKVTNVVDQTLFQLTQESESALSRLAPVVDYVDASLLILKFTRSKPTIASIVGDESEVPIQRTRVIMLEEYLNETRLAKQYVFKNGDFTAMKKLEDAMRDKNINAALIGQFKNLFFGYAADLPVSIVEKLTMLLMIVITKGTVDYTDPITGLKFVVSYPDVITSGINQLLYTANPAPGDAWGNVAAQGLLQMENHALAWYRNFGVFPPNVRMRYNLFLDLKAQDYTKRAVAVKRGYGATAGDIAAMSLEDEDVIDLIKSRMKVNDVEFFDHMYSEEDINGGVSDKYFLPDDTYFISEPGNLERAFVPTPEKDFAQGIYVKARQLDDAPRKERIVGLGAGIPAVFDARKLAARKVK